MPTLAILVAPPAIVSAAWLVITGGTPDGVFDGLTAMTVFMVLIQVMLLPCYRALPFSLSFWSFTFLAASVAALAITWLHLMRPFAWRALTMGLTSIVTILIALIATKSVLSLRGRAAGACHLETCLATA